MDQLFIRQEELRRQIENKVTNYKKSPKGRITSTYIEVRLETLEKLWKTFTDTHFEILAKVKVSEKKDLAYFKENYYDETEEEYSEYKTKLKEDLAAITAKSTPNVSSAKNNEVQVQQGGDTPLPAINLPHFSGKYQEWQKFHDMFTSIIHINKRLTPVQKLHYLKGCVSGEPSNLLNNLDTTNDNYEEAWECLRRRYSNKRYVAREVWKRLFNQKPVSGESPTAIKELLDTTASCIKSFKNLGVTTDHWDVLIVNLVVSKLDNRTKREWEAEVSRTKQDELPTWPELVKFLENHHQTLDMVDDSRKSAQAQFQIKIKQPRHKAFHSAMQEEKVPQHKLSCSLCNAQHLLYQCKQFGGKTPQERVDFVQNKSLCFNCLAPDHNVRACRRPMCCRRCGRRHHTLLHVDKHQPQHVTAINVQDPQTSASQETSETNVVAHFITEKHHPEVLLATALAKAKSKNGYSQLVRVLVDQGSEASFICESTVQSLALKKTPVNGLISGVGNGQSRTKSMVTFEIESLHNSNCNIKVNAFVLSSLTSFLPSTTTSILNWPELKELPLADPKYGYPGKIDIILGVDVHSDILLEGLIKHPSKSGTIAQNTKLGWILSGKVSKENLPNPRIVNLHLQIREDEFLKQFWEIEREPDRIGKKLTKEEVKCEEIYENNTMRNEEGRYVVRLPFKEANPRCMYGKSKEIALKRYDLLEKKLKRNPTLKIEYTKVLEDYISQNHMVKIEEKEEIEKSKAVYLPHHAVVREDKETTKVRVVFDASCKGSNNVSLNDTLLVGPKLQQDLRHILMRWRVHRICVVADLKQMYRQVLVDQKDTDFQRILWRSSPERPVEYYRLLRLTFGTACAPYLAVKSLQQLAKDEQANYPVASKITLEDYYMDDLLTGCQTEREAVEIYEQMNKLMKAGGFELQKWSSNNQSLLNHIEKENQRANTSLVFKTNNMIKVLGITWNKINDHFEYTYNLPDIDEPITKRKVLSDIARLYDPMGWIAPIIVVAKVFIQKLWKSGLSWDERLTPDLLKEWLSFRTELTKINMIVIPRWLSTLNNDMVELHAFADASQKSYAAVVYLKSKNVNGINVRLVTAKTKVAPIEKEISIPRLELCAALLAAKLMYEVAQVMAIPKERMYAWSDSTVVLAWLNGEPSRWVTFVSNRVSEILSILDSEQWRHIRTEINPADCASRGATIVELANSQLWWNGPQFLCRQDEYPKTNSFQTHEEQKPIRSLTAQVKTKEDFIWTRFSNLPKLLRVLSYCRRFRNLLKPKDQRVKDKVVYVEERNEVLNIIIKKTQEYYFEKELKQLKSHGKVPKSTPLRTLAPFLDGKGVLRVGGRIEKSAESFDKRHPVILPSNSHITYLIILDAHVKTLHGGPQLMMNFLRSNYWIIRCRERVKKCYRECVVCTRYSRQNSQQFMGELPSVRLTPDKPFKSTGVDFTGHINIRFSPGRGSKSYKGYICLFVCMATKAIHLEAVSDLSSSGFIAAFRRFVSRRGRCQNLYSDNGTNFVGADKELQEMFDRAKSQLPDELTHLLANEGTTWHFIPPGAPNFGGLWEAGVRSTKTHLKRVIGDSTLTFEELTTVLTQVEACLNSRPLSLLSDNPVDPLPLTPGHFIVGEPLINIPNEQYSEATKLSGLQRWKLTQKMVSDFWRKWSDEYLVNLNQRFKWNKMKCEPELNDVVIIRDANIPPAKWLLAKPWNSRHWTSSSDKYHSIIDGASGAIRPGRLTFILGPSGAGKTTLMKILAGRKKIGVTGSLYGIGRNAVMVSQNTALIDTLTAMETLKFAAALKLPNESQRDRNTIIKNITKQLGIHDVLHTRAGQLSGGERKRLTIACELLTDPTIMLLDEPTSGLDAVSSISVAQALLTIARSGRTVACVIHQPSSKLFTSADDVIVLAQGRTLYAGPVVDVPSALLRAGFSCPQYYNVADYLLEVATNEHNGNRSLLENEANTYAQEMSKIARKSGHNIIGRGTGPIILEEAETLLNPRLSPSEGYQANLWQQLCALFWRCCIGALRDVHLTQIRIVTHFIVALLLGALYNGAGAEAGRIISNTGCLFFFLLFLFFSNAMPTIHTFPVEATVVLQEHLNKWYSLLTYCVSKVIVDLPIQLLCATVFLFPAWYLTSQPMEPYRMGLAWLICALVTVLAQTFGLVVGAAFDIKLGLFVIPAANIPMLMFSEFFIPYHEMPVYLQPFAFISYFRYAFDAFLQVVYGFDRGPLPCHAEFCMFKRPNKYLDYLGLSLEFKQDLIALVIWIVLLQISLVAVLYFRVYRACR